MTADNHLEVGEAPEQGLADLSVQLGENASLTARDQRRNFRLGVINGAIFRIGDVFIDTEMVLTWFLAQLGVSNLLIGLVSPIRFGGSFLLQLLASSYMERQPYKQPFYRAISVFRSTILLVFALMVVLVPVGSPWLVVAFFAALTLFSLSAGLVNIPFMDVVGKVIPARRRGAFFGQRMFYGGIFALGGSSVVGFLFGESGLPFPINVSVMFVLSAIFYGLTAWSWILVKEPPSPLVLHDAPGHKPGAIAALAKQLKRGFRVLKEDALYRHLALVHLVLLVGDWSSAFYVVYARRELGIQAGLVGLYLGVRTVASILSNLVWGRVSDGRGNRALIITTTVVGMATPLIALLIGTISRSAPGGAVWLGYAFAAVFLTSGAYSSGSGIGLMNYLMDTAPDEQRPLYLAFNNTIFGLVRFAAMASGLIVDWAGFRVLFGISVVAYGVAFGLSLTMSEPRAQIRLQG